MKPADRGFDTGSKEMSNEGQHFETVAVRAGADRDETGDRATAPLVLELRVVDCRHDRSRGGAYKNQKAAERAPVDYRG
jgi:hypothetical protein